MPVQEGLQPPVANLLSYLLGFIGGLVMFLTQKNREVRFHAAQSILLNISIIVLFIGFSILLPIMVLIDPTGVVATVFGLLLSLILPLGVLAIVIVMCIQGYQQKHMKLPLIGNFAERWAGGGV